VAGNDVTSALFHQLRMSFRAIWKWMNVVSQILFYGAELCKVMSEAE
jgi:hypothetical protein